MRESDIREESRARLRGSRWWRVGSIIVAAALAGVLAAWEFTSWKVWTWVVVLTIVGITALSIVGPIGTLRTEEKIQAADKRETDMLKIVVGLIFELHCATGIDVNVIGVSVWKVYTPRKRLFGGKRGSDSLARQARQRIDYFPPPSDEDWVKGKGVIGRCWQEGGTIYKDWRKLQMRHHDASSISNSVWRRIVKDGEAWGFSQDTYLKAIRKYDQVIAVPIVDEAGKFLGCLSVDIPCPGGNEDHSASEASGSIDSAPIRNMLANAAENLRTRF